MTSASGAILVLCDRAVFAANVIPFSFEIICVTGRTERLVLGKWPGNSSTDNRAVAAGAAWIIPVIPWVVPLWAMAETGRRPAIGGMAHVALLRRV